MAVPARTVRLAAGLAILAAFLWATYYYYVLTLSSGARPAAVLAYPFLAAGVVFLGVTIRQGTFGHFVRLWRSPVSYVRIALLAGMQISVLASTYAAGPVDTSLLSLVGDVVITPLLLMLLYAEGRERARSLPFLGGLSLSTVGAALTIVGGASATPIHGVAWLVAPTVPLTVAFYFLLTARVNRSIPSYAVVGQSTIGAAILCFALSPLLPGGVGGLLLPSVHDAVLLVGLGVVCFFVAPMLYFVAIERAGLFLPALLMATIPLFTLLVQYVAFGLSASVVALLGVPIAVAGGFLSVQGSHPGWAPSYTKSSDGSGK